MIGHIIFWVILAIMAVGWWFDDTKPRRPRGSRRVEKRWARAAKRQREVETNPVVAKFEAERRIEREKRRRNALVQEVSWALSATGEYALTETRAAVQLFLRSGPREEFDALFEGALRILKTATNEG